MNIDKKFFYKKSDYIKRSINTYFFERRLNLLFISFVFLLCVLAIVLIKGQINILVWIMIGLYVLSQISMPITIFLQENKRHENSKDMQTERQINITNEGTNDLFGRNNNKLKWNSFHKIVFFKGMILFYFDSNQSFMLPKREITKDEYKEIKKVILSQKEIKKNVKSSWLL